jgi:hypothetical protein
MGRNRWGDEIEPDVGSNRELRAFERDRKLKSTTPGQSQPLRLFARFIDPNEKTFRDEVAPQAIADMVGLIEKLFMCENWSDTIDVHADTLTATVRRTDRGEAAICQKI